MKPAVSHWKLLYIQLACIMKCFFLTHFFINWDVSWLLHQLPFITSKTYFLVGLLFFSFFSTTAFESSPYFVLFLLRSVLFRTSNLLEISLCRALRSTSIKAVHFTSSCMLIVVLVIYCNTRHLFKRTKVKYA